MNGIGQGSFAAPLASSLNIGCAVEGIIIGEIELNSLNFKDYIAKMNRMLEDAKKGSKDVGTLVESKQLRANPAKSKFAVIRTPESRTEILKESEANPIMMGDTIIENSKSKKNLGDQIHEDGCAASISATLDSRIPIAIERGNTII